MSESRIDVSHEMVGTPIGSSECQNCWACTCHHADELEHDCTSRVPSGEA